MTAEERYREWRRHSDHAVLRPIIQELLAERDEARADANGSKFIRELAEAKLNRVENELVRVQADAEGLAEALAYALTQTECKGYCSDNGCPFCGGTLRPARAALAAHEERRADA